MRNKSKKKRKTSVKLYRLTIKCNKLYERVHNIQVDYINKLSRDLCKHNELIVLEDLDLMNMAEHTSYKDSKTSTKGGNHGKSIGLLQWYYFCQKLEQNSEKFGNVIVYVDKYFPSSQICSKCGEIHSEMKDVTNRTLKCKCGNIIDRDYNSAINLLKADYNLNGCIYEPKGSYFYPLVLYKSYPNAVVIFCKGRTKNSLNTLSKNTALTICSAVLI